MQEKKRTHHKKKKGLHPRSKHREPYDFNNLIKVLPELKTYVRKNKYNNLSIDFANPDAVKALNTALLLLHYKLNFWDIPPHYLCPSVPGRADYIHSIADLLASEYKGVIPNNIRVLDVGVGANCIYPIIGNNEYDWSFVGSDIDTIAILSAKQIVKKNEFLTDKIEFRIQKDKRSIFDGIIKPKEHFDITICNPPFHPSSEEARNATLRKLKNLKLSTSKPVLNFGGGANELWCRGGELRFILSMIKESKGYSHAVFWFSTLVSKQSNLHSIYASLKKVRVSETQTIPLSQGNKKSRILAWTFLSLSERNNWAQNR